MWSSSRSKPALGRALRRARRTRRAPRSMSARSISRGTWLMPAKYGSGDGAMIGQLPSSSGWSIALPHAASSSPCARRGRAGCRSSRRACACTKSTMRCQAPTCSSSVHARAARRDPALGETSVISVITSPAPPSARRRGARGGSRPGAVDREYMSIGETTTRFGSTSPRRRNGVNIGGRRGVGCRPLNAASTVGDEARVAQLQVVVGDAPAARQQVEGELRGSWPT